MQDGDYGFEIINVVDSAHDISMLEFPHNAREWCIYVPKSVYDADMLPGQETLEKATQQFILDVPRSDFITDCHAIHPDLKRYCTQAVMALPVQILTNFGIVAELRRRSRMRIVIGHRVATISKDLRFFKERKNEWQRITVRVFVDLDSSVCKIIIILA